MGAVLADASLQAGVRYATTVLPRVRRLLAEWPDAVTTSALIQRLDDPTTPVASVLSWKSEGKKLSIFRALAGFLHAEGIETTSQLRESLADAAFRGQLRRIKGVGAKTVDYLSILTGSTDHAAVDSQLRAFARDAGVKATSYDDVRRAVLEAAAARGWAAGSLDAAIWAYQSGGASVSSPT